jgi:molecular chaperone GrpE (heat shock protein)
VRVENDRAKPAGEQGYGVVRTNSSDWRHDIRTSAASKKLGSCLIRPFRRPKKEMNWRKQDLERAVSAAAFALGELRFDAIMLQKCAILGVVFLLAGGAIFGWLYREAENERLRTQSLVPVNVVGSQEYIEKYGRWYQLTPEQQSQLALELDRERKSKTPEELSREQRARLQADMEKLAAGQIDPGDIADFLYGRGWESQVEQYKAQKEQVQSIQTIAIVCLSIGGVLFGASVAFGLLRLPVRVLRALKRRREPEPALEPVLEEPTDTDPHDAKPPEEPEAPAPEEQPRQRRKLVPLSEALREAHEGESGSEPLKGIDDVFHAIAAGAGSTEGGWTAPKTTNPPTSGLPAVAPESGVALLLADEPSPERGWSPQSQWSLSSGSENPSGNLSQEQSSMRESTGWPSGQGVASPAQDPLREQAEDLQKQIAEFKQVAQNVQQATREQSAPLGDTLKELAQQVSAIREYAATQQNRVEKLQDGYDWGIIRTFCLRVIRCIDNLEGRLDDLPKGDSATRHLEEVKDELLFALESSGIEQFRPEVNSEFQGQEKLAEALKEKQPAKKPEQVGKIARVIRPGYRYMMDDESYRIVRIAQVKVYG